MDCDESGPDVTSLSTSGEKTGKRTKGGRSWGKESWKRWNYFLLSPQLPSPLYFHLLLQMKERTNPLWLDTDEMLCNMKKNGATDKRTPRCDRHLPRERVGRTFRHVIVGRPRDLQTYEVNKGKRKVRMSQSPPLVGFLSCHWFWIRFP